MIRLLIIIILGTVYICSPVDLIPDPALPVGAADDLAVLVGMVISFLNQIKDDPAANRTCLMSLLAVSGTAAIMVMLVFIIFFQ